MERLRGSDVVREYPSLFLLLYVVAGILLADQLRLPSWPSLLVGVICLLLVFYSVHGGRPRMTAVAIGLSFCAMSAFHFSLNHVDIGPGHLSRVASSKQVYHVYGRVADWPDLRSDRTEIKITVDSLRSGRTLPVYGAVILKITDTTTALQRGDRVEFKGRIYPVEQGRHRTGKFDYGRFLNLKGVQGVVYLPTVLGVRVDSRSDVGYLGIVDDLRSYISVSLKHNLTPVSAALASGFLIGETRDIPADVYTMFRDSGTLHVLAVSGSNVAVVVVFFLFVLRPFRLSRNRRSVILLGVIILFAGVCYGDPSVVRASVMASLVLIVRILGRRYDLNNIIALAALILLLFDPAQLYDVGFQLSFVTAWGLIAFVPRLTALFETYHGRVWYRFGVFPLLIAVVAQLCSTPVIAFYFERVPVISVFANIVVVPLAGVAVVAILALLTSGLVLPLLGTFVGSLVDPFLRLIVWLLRLMGGESMPVLNTGELLDGSVGLGFVLLAYLLLMLGFWSIRSLRARRCGMIVAAIALNLVLVRAVWSGTDADSATLSLHSVPGGVAGVIGYPERDVCDLVLTGLARKKYSIDETILSPMLQREGFKRIDRIFVLSADYDALGDLANLARRLDANCVYTTARLCGSLHDVIRARDSSRTPIEIVCAGKSECEREAFGLFVSGSGIIVRTREIEVCLVDRVSADLVEPDTTVDNRVLVIGSRWHPSAADWIDLRAAGFTSICCSKVEQPETGQYVAAEQEPDAALPEYVHDLDRSGAVRFDLIRCARNDDK